MLNPNPQAKVADFGLSQKVEDSAYYTSTNSDTRLPIRWMAPEVFQSQKFGEASDVWAYGITLVELYSRAAYGKLRHHFGTISLLGPTPPPHALAVWCALISALAHRMLIGGRDWMLCPIHVFRLLTFFDRPFDKADRLLRDPRCASVQLPHFG